MNINSKININFVLQEYKNQLSELLNENVMLMAYVKQLEEENRELREASDSVSEE